MPHANRCHVGPYVHNVCLLDPVHDHVFHAFGTTLDIICVPKHHSLIIGRASLLVAFLYVPDYKALSQQMGRAACTSSSVPPSTAPGSRPTPHERNLAPQPALIKAVYLRRPLSLCPLAQSLYSSPVRPSPYKHFPVSNSIHDLSPSHSNPPTPLIEAFTRSFIHTSTSNTPS